VDLRAGRFPTAGGVRPSWRRLTRGTATVGAPRGGGTRGPGQWRASAAGRGDRTGVGERWCGKAGGRRRERESDVTR
jgi:hypothetical protein